MSGADEAPERPGGRLARPGGSTISSLFLHVTLVLIILILTTERLLTDNSGTEVLEQGVHHVKFGARLTIFQCL